MEALNIRIPPTPFCAGASEAVFCSSSFSSKKYIAKLKYENIYFVERKKKWSTWKLSSKRFPTTSSRRESNKSAGLLQQQQPCTSRTPNTQKLTFFWKITPIEENCVHVSHKQNPDQAGAAGRAKWHPVADTDANEGKSAPIASTENLFSKLRSLFSADVHPKPSDRGVFRAGHVFLPDG